MLREQTGCREEGRRAGGPVGSHQLPSLSEANGTRELECEALISKH